VTLSPGGLSTSVVRAELGTELNGIMAWSSSSAIFLAAERILSEVSGIQSGRSDLTLKVNIFRKLMKWITSQRKWMESIFAERIYLKRLEISGERGGE
jgi:hypothetical protein